MWCYVIFFSTDYSDDDACKQVAFTKRIVRHRSTTFLPSKQLTKAQDWDRVISRKKWKVFFSRKSIQNIAIIVKKLLRITNDSKDDLKILTLKRRWMSPSLRKNSLQSSIYPLSVYFRVLQGYSQQNLLDFEFLCFLLTDQISSERMISTINR